MRSATFCLAARALRLQAERNFVLGLFDFWGQSDHENLEASSYRVQFYLVPSHSECGGGELVGFVCFQEAGAHFFQVEVFSLVGVFSSVFLGFNKGEVCSFALFFLFVRSCSGVEKQEVEVGF